MIRRLGRAAGLDRAGVYALSSRAWSICSSFVMLTLVIRYLSAEEQGYYYTFAALLGAQILFELGMGVVVTHFASHSMAHLGWNSDGLIAGNADDLSRLSSLVKLVFRWYSLVTVVVLAVLGPIGWLFLQTSQPHSAVAWHGPWVCVIAATALNLLIQPLLSLLEGCQCVAQVARIRLTQGILGSLVAWTTLLLGGGLYSLAVWGAMTALVAIAIMWHERGAFFQQMLQRQTAGTPAISWRNEVWPFQWRIALSWISGYFIFQMFVPVLFATSGPAEAGRMGLSLAIASALMGLPLAWFNTKVPRFGQLIALRDYAKLDLLWTRATTTTLLLLFLGGIAIVGLAYFLQLQGTVLGHRLLGSGQLAMLVIATAANYLMIAQASYLRAHKEEPFLWVSVTYGLLVAASTLLLAPPYGALGVLAGYLACSLTCGTLWGSIIFLEKRRIYRAAVPHPS